MYIRKASREDLHFIMEIEEKSFKSPWTYEMFNYYIGSEGFLVFVIDHNIVGYIIVRLQRSFRGKIAHLDSIAVHPDWRRKGIGSYLLKMGIEYATCKGAKTMQLKVREHNLPAILLYTKFGFKIIGIKKNYYITENAIKMEKELVK
ncbi:MAG: ribosomal protein S18-alanine N-acetyltransferase [Methanosarcinales archaeon]